VPKEVVLASATINLPEKNDIESVLSFGRELDNYAFHEGVVIDFGSNHFFPPYAMLFLAAKIRHFRSKRSDIKIEFKNYKDHPHLAHMGFFRMFDMEYGRDIGEAWGGENYLPITRLARSDLYTESVDEFRELADLIQRDADRIALVIARDKSQNSDMFDVLSYSVREVMRNVFEHSQSDELFYCAQYWPKSNKVEFALADFGVGIRRGLSENPNFRFKSDKEAIEYSLLPSVSGKTHLPRTSEIWFNSGYGLYMTSKLARNGGNFVLASGQDAVHLSRKTKKNYRTSFPGTVLRFNLDVTEIGNVQDRLSQFRKDGAEIAKNITGSGNRPPSAMSLLLRRDYTR